MTNATFTISAFGDEIAPNLADQLQVMNKLEINHLELRAAWGNNVLKFDDEEAAKVRQLCDTHGVNVSCIGSPVGKSPIEDPIEKELNNLSRLYQIADIVGTRNVRVFSFYPPDTEHPKDASTNEHYDQHLDEAIDRLRNMADHAQKAGFYLMLENEKGIVGDTVARCKAICQAVDNPHLKFLWDPANFVQVNEEKVTERAWPILGLYVGYVHIKDSRLADRTICPAGEGDGQIGELLDKLKESGYQGYLALEPHLKLAQHSSGFSGADGMEIAVKALRKVMTEHGCEESK
jgi:sugar phosphate isomerase/epimerase